MDIKIRVKNVYGNTLYYPANNERVLHELTGAKTLTARHINALNMLGHNFIVVPETIPQGDFIPQT